MPSIDYLLISYMLKYLESDRTMAIIWHKLVECGPLEDEVDHKQQSFSL